MYREHLTAERVRERLDYNPETGQFFWRASPNNRMKLGSIAGTRTDDGYWKICIDRFQIKGHRLAWIYMTSEWPVNQVDHIDGIRDNNKWANLRAATKSENQQNLKRVTRANKTSSFLGVHWDSSRQRWIARIKLNGKLKKLGSFKCEKEASEAYLKEKRVLHPFCTI